MSRSKLDDLIAENQRKPRRPRRKPEPQSPNAEERQQARQAFVQRFVSEFLNPANSWNATHAYLVAANGGNTSTPGRRAYHEMQKEDVRAELHRQLAAMLKQADLTEEWCYRQWESMAKANIFDYVDIDEKGGVRKFKLDPQALTPEQQLNIRELKFSAQTGRLIGIRLADREGSVANVAKALKMFTETEDRVNDLQQLVTEMMQKASKRLPQPRTFDNDTGEEIK